MHAINVHLLQMHGEYKVQGQTDPSTIPFSRRNTDPRSLTECVSTKSVELLTLHGRWAQGYFLVPGGGVHANYCPHT